MSAAVVELSDVSPAPSRSERAIFDGVAWTRWTSEHWEVPIVASILYLVMIVFLKRYMASREKMRLQGLVIAWNFSLSFFSFAGLAVCVPHLLNNPHSGLLSKGWYASVCAHCSAYGYGQSGFFVALFIYSKLAELVDTVFLLLRKSPVILLHWYHHLTVLLYCWHSYVTRIGTGLWFASMNYSVHAIMYFYFGLTQCGPRGRKFARKFAMLITTFQLLQMVVGIAVTVASVYYHSIGEVCYVSLVNSTFGLLMYTSYFFLFLQLFIENCACSPAALHVARSLG
jgi:elongation of very long chain fatty acids protein 6